MREFGSISLVVSVLVLAGCASLAAQETESLETRVTVQTDDGSRIVGRARGGSVAVRTTALGALSLPLRAVERVEFENDGETARILLRNGDTIHGRTDVESMKIETSLGVVGLPPGRVRSIVLAPQLVVSLPILFEHPCDAIDWQQYHSITEPVVTDGALAFTVTGSYPWLIRSRLALPAESCDVLVIRMRKSAGARGQVHWSTDKCDRMCNIRHLEFETIPDGKFHDIRVPVGRHSEWKDTITVLCIGPDAVGEPSEVAIESIRAERDESARAIEAADAPVVSILEGTGFLPAPGLVEKEVRSLEYSQEAGPGFVRFVVPEHDRAMKWSRVFFHPIDTGKYEFLELQYRAENLAEDDGDFIIWLNDKRDYRHGGFEAVVGREIRTDGLSHTIRLPLSRFNPTWPLAQVVVRVAGSEKGGAVFTLERLDFTRGEMAPASLSLLDGRAFVAAPQWVHESRRSTEYRHSVEPGFAQFTVEDPGRNMKWGISLDEPIDPKEWPQLLFEYRAQRMYDDGSEYVLWVSDDAREDHSGGYEVILPREIISDGEPHTICVNLARFNPPGRVRGLLIRVHSGDEGGAVLQVEKLEFLAAPRAPQVTAPLSLLDGTAFEPKPEWVRDKSALSLDYGAKAEPGFASYAVNDAEREMKWLRRLETVVDPKGYRWLEFRYRARGFRRRDDGGCVIWLGDPRSTNWGGFETVMAREIVADGKPHTVLVPMPRFNPAGSIDKVLVRVASDSQGQAVIEIERLEFVLEDSAP